MLGVEFMAAQRRLRFTCKDQMTRKVLGSISDSDDYLGQIVAGAHLLFPWSSANIDNDLLVQRLPQ